MNGGQLTNETIKQLYCRYSEALELAIKVLKESQNFVSQQQKLIQDDANIIKRTQRNNFLFGVAVGSICLFLILLCLSYLN